VVCQCSENFAYLVPSFSETTRYDNRLVPARISLKPSQNVFLRN